MQKGLSVAEMIKALRESGYRVERGKTYVKHTFEVEPELLARFFQLQQRSGVKIKDAINDALDLWIKHNGKRTD